jgi:polysaccharide biosynthesis protein PelG
MAGIGFELKRLGQRDNLLGPLASMGHAAVLAAGPWLITIISLGLIGTATTPLTGPETQASFRVMIVYAFALSLVATGPVVIVATRLVSDAIYLEQFERVRAIFLAALGVGSIVTAIPSLLVYFVAFHLQPEAVVTAFICTVTVAMIWVTLAFCSAVRDFNAITLGFLIGLAIAVLSNIGLARRGMGALAMVWGFTGGLAVIAFWLSSRVLVTFRLPARQLARPLRELVIALGRYWPLALGGLLGAIGLWLDKWIIWATIGEHDALGLLHAPIYDSAMFLGYLALIPSLALFVTTLETTFFDLYRGYFDSIKNHATLSQIQRNGKALTVDTLRSLSGIFLVHIIFCAIVVLLASLIVKVTGLHYQQTGILRLGAVGAIFQFLLLACSSLLLFFERYAHYAWLQVLFLFLQATLTPITLALGPAYYGFGYLLSALICGLLALFVLERTLSDLNYLTFVVSTTKERVAVDSS